ELSANRHLADLLDTLRRLVLFYRSALLQRSKSDAAGKALYLERLRVKQDRHREILAALVGKDGVQAAQLMQSHVRETAEALLPALPETPLAADHANAA